MADPGERVPLNERRRDEPPPLRDHGRDEQCEGDARAREVQTAAGAIDVLAEIEGIEIAETAVCGLVVHGGSPKRHANHTAKAVIFISARSPAMERSGNPRLSNWPRLWPPGLRRRRGSCECR